MPMKAFQSLLAIIFYPVIVTASSCYDDDGNPVDWFIGYKLPNSFEYMFMLPNAVFWNKSSHTVDKGGMLNRTFTHMFGLYNDSDSVFGMYNDEIPKGVITLSPYWGHMKGAFGFTLNQSGFWLIHSIPKLSVANDSYHYPETGYIYGQHFLCITLKASDLGLVVDQLSIGRPLVQGYFLSENAAKLYPKLTSLLNNKKVDSTLNATSKLITASGNLNMIHFSKSSFYNIDLYRDFVAPVLGEALDVESWRHGENEPSICDGPLPPVMNVKSLQFPHYNIAFTAMEDHSKWAVTVPRPRHVSDGDALECGEVDDSMWTCLGDINRQWSQFHRGGGTMCLRNQLIWKAFTGIIAEVYPCTQSASYSFLSYLEKYRPSPFI